MRKKKEDTCLLSPRSAYMNCSRPGSGNKCCNFSIAPILPRDKLSCTTHSETIKYQIFTTNPCHSSWPQYHRYKPTLEWKQPLQQQKEKQQENTNLHASHAACIHSCSVKRNKLRKGYFHDTNYGRKEPNRPQIINMELGTVVCISTKEKKERGFQ